MAAIKDFSAARLHSFISANVVPELTAKIDGWPTYEDVSAIAHDPQIIGSIAAHIAVPQTQCVLAKTEISRMRLNPQLGQ
ncbi:hypothetical protein DF3PA_20166 [Candidatus Defluviicoccus seviourii]|uniref:Uncharacterized protein n=2 Tax=root TaxID=1 RepID=A0A564WCR2_9PROT|nr:hypothetical protein DF3PB_4620005 [uncultured Defluviicoccus sp.]VUX46266.1 hypothetical protein DF3PA_20166 [Candidatus Defluviicoccus seviourii]